MKIIELEKSLLETWKVFRLFLNTLTADDKYSVISRHNSIPTIQTQLFQEQKIFSEFSAAIFQCGLNFKDFQKKDDPHSFCIPEITYPERVA